MPSPSPDGKRRVCLVTAEFHGLFKNGGIGTANTGLAVTLAEAGHDVTVAYIVAGLVDFDERVAAAPDTIAAWGKRGVKLEFAPRNPLLRAGHEDHVAASFNVFSYLQGRGFDVVFFNECGGQGRFSLLAKKAGLFPEPPRMIVVTHGANAWVLELNAQLYWSLHPISVDFLERRSVELADMFLMTKGDAAARARLVDVADGRGRAVRFRRRERGKPRSGRDAAAAPGAGERRAADAGGRLHRALFRGGAASLHHPLVGRPALVRLRNAVFQGATGLRASFGVEHEQSRPVEFALWARRSGPLARNIATLAGSYRFSGWTAVRAAFRQHQTEIAFPEPLRQPHDLYLATRVIDAPENSYCQAVWRDIFVIETAQRAA